MATNYQRKAKTVRLPVVTSSQINAFSSGSTSVYGSRILNGVVQQYPDQTFYVTQRPTLNISDDPDTASPAVTEDQGRGIYYWDEMGGGAYVDASYVVAGYVLADQVPDLYVINADTAYKGSYNTAMGGASLTTGTERVYIRELGTKLVFLDPENNEMFYTTSIDAANLYTMNFSAWSPLGPESITFAAGTSITTTTTRSPTLSSGDKIKISGSASNDGTYTVSSDNGTVITTTEATASETVSCTLTAYGALPQNNSRTLAHGLAVLDQTMYVLATDGTVWGSALADGQNWTDALNVITAEREEDQGVYIDKHKEHIVVFGTKTIEFMYDAGNETGSPLATRQEHTYNIGCADPNSVWRHGDTIYFLGKDAADAEVRPYKLHNFEVVPIAEGSVASYFSDTGYRFLGSGVTVAGTEYYIITTASVSTTVNPIESNVYNSTTDSWTVWEYSSAETTDFPLIDFTAAGSSLGGYGQLTTGAVVQVADNFTPTEDGSNVTMKIRMDNFDNGNRDWKFAHRMRYVGDSTSAAQTLTIRWADNNNDTYSTGRTIDISSPNNKLTRLGRFKSRSHELEYSGSEQVRIEGLDLDVTDGVH